MPDVFVRNNLIVNELVDEVAVIWKPANYEQSYYYHKHSHNLEWTLKCL